MAHYIYGVGLFCGKVLVIYIHTCHVITCPASFVTKKTQIHIELPNAHQTETYPILEATLKVWSNNRVWWQSGHLFLVGMLKLLSINQWQVYHCWE